MEADRPSVVCATKSGAVSPILSVIEGPPSMRALRAKDVSLRRSRPRLQLPNLPRPCWARRRKARSGLASEQPSYAKAAASSLVRMPTSRCRSGSWCALPGGACGCGSSLLTSGRWVASKGKGCSRSAGLLIWLGPRSEYRGRRRPRPPVLRPPRDLVSGCGRASDSTGDDEGHGLQ